MAPINNELVLKGLMFNVCKLNNWTDNLHIQFRDCFWLEFEISVMYTAKIITQNRVKREELWNQCKDYLQMAWHL